MLTFQAAVITVLILCVKYQRDSAGKLPTSCKPCVLSFHSVNTPAIGERNTIT